jgi:hypothetical protein
VCRTTSDDQDANKTTNNKDKTPKKIKLAAAPSPKDVPPARHTVTGGIPVAVTSARNTASDIPVVVTHTVPMAPTSATLATPVDRPTRKSDLIVDSLSTDNDRLGSARDTVPSAMLTSRTVEEQDIEQYAEQIESMSNDELIELIHRTSFVDSLGTSHTSLLPKLVECSLSGASFYRNLMKIIGIVLQSNSDPLDLIVFAHSIRVPDLSLKYLKSIVEHATIRQEVEFRPIESVRSPAAVSFAYFSLGSHIYSTIRCTSFISGLN